MLYLKFTPVETLNVRGMLNVIVPLVKMVEEKLKIWGLQQTIYNFTLLYKDHKGIIEEIINEFATTTEEHATTEHLSVQRNQGITTTTDILYTHETSAYTSTDKLKSDTNDTHINMFLNHSTIETNSTADNVSIWYILMRVGFYTDEYSVGINVSVIDDMLNMEGETIEIETDCQYNISLSVSLEDMFLKDFTNKEVVSIQDVNDHSTLEILHYKTTMISKIISFKYTVPVVIADKLGCPLVRVSITEISVVTISNNTIYIYGNRIDRKQFYEHTDEEYKNVTDYLVCSHVYLHSIMKLQPIQPNWRKTDERPTAKQIVSVTCLTLSVLCSVFTLLTYCMFGDLRTQPGLNNMGLVVSLIIAQILFQFGIGQAGLIPDWACNVIGLLLHLFWLMVIFWMNVCTIHMFSVFRRLRKMKLRRTDKLVRTTVIYSVYCFVASSVFVVINTITTFISSNGDDFGYGGQICFISKSEMLGYMFAYPIFLIVFVNILLFLFVAFQINRIPNVQSSIKSNRNYLLIYANLASITGLTWVSGAVFYTTNSELIEYIFIIFNAGQGVFIFLSFVCNKRVLRMYIEKFDCRSASKQITQQIETNETELHSVDRLSSSPP